MKTEKEWLEVMKILIKYKFAEIGTAESTANEICDLFLNKNKKAPKEMK